MTQSDGVGTRSVQGFPLVTDKAYNKEIINTENYPEHGSRCTIADSFLLTSLFGVVGVPYYVIKVHTKQKLLKISKGISNCSVNVMRCLEKSKCLDIEFVHKFVRVNTAAMRGGVVK